MRCLRRARAPFEPTLQVECSQQKILVERKDAHHDFQRLCSNYRRFLGDGVVVERQGVGAVLRGGGLTRVPELRERELAEARASGGDL